MNKRKKMLKGIRIFLSWLIFSPLLIIFGKRWGLKRWMYICFGIVSPFTALLVVFLLILSFAWYWEYSDKQYDKYIRSRYSEKSHIEEAIGMEFPNYIELGREMTQPMHLTGDFTMSVYLKFTEDNDLDMFYKELEEKGWGRNWYIRLENKGRESNEEFGYNHIDESSMTTFGLSISKRDSTAVLSYGKI